MAEHEYRQTSSTIEVNADNNVTYTVFEMQTGAPLMVMTYSIDQADELGSCFIQAAMVARERAGSA